MHYIDPTRHRLSDYFLLSDFMGCDSVYRRGYSNKITLYDAEKLKEGARLAQILEILQEDFGPCHICYGYISPELSQNIIKYQDPNKPSYHRWELGAAADVHFPLYMPHNSTDLSKNPAKLAHIVDEKVIFSRMITYSESEWICFATKVKEKPPKRTFYENRLIPDSKKPLFVRYSPDSDKRQRQKEESAMHHASVDWRGQGWPSYHGGGRKQYEHTHIGNHFSVIDFLYSKHKVHAGEHNRPPVNGDYLLWEECAKQAAIVLEFLYRQIGRVSITSAYNRSLPEHQWKTHFTLEVALPLPDQSDALSVSSSLADLAEVKKALVVSVGDENRIRIIGNRI